MLPCQIAQNCFPAGKTLWAAQWLSSGPVANSSQSPASRMSTKSSLYSDPAIKHTHISPLWVSTRSHFLVLPLGMTSALMWWHLLPSHLSPVCAECLWVSCCFFSAVMASWWDDSKIWGLRLVPPSCSSSDSAGMRSWMWSLNRMLN